MEEPSIEALKRDDALRLATLLVDAPNVVPLSVAESEVERELRRRCAEFWLGTWHGRAKPFTARNGEKREADRMVPKQLRLFDSTISSKEGVFHYMAHNNRRMRELPRHLALSGMKTELQEELSTPATIDFYVHGDSPDSGELRSLFDILGGLDFSTGMYADVITRYDTQLQRDTSVR